MVNHAQRPHKTPRESDSTGFGITWDRTSLSFLLKSGLSSVGLFLVCLALDGAIYPAYNLKSLLAGLALYNKGFALGLYGTLYGSSLWGAVRHFVPVTAGNQTACILIGLLPLIPVWVWRDRMSYSARCFLAIVACTLSTPVLADYHLLIFVVPLLLLKREDPAFWPILLSCCWLLIPKLYEREEVLSLQTYWNPGAIVVAVVMVMLAQLREAPRQTIKP
jgi:hypothetical protein